MGDPAKLGATGQYIKNFIGSNTKYSSSFQWILTSIQNIYMYTLKSNSPLATKLSTIFPSFFISSIFSQGSIFSSFYPNSSSYQIPINDTIHSISYETLQNFNKLNPIQYNITMDPNNQLHYGFLTSDIESNIPDLLPIEFNSTNLSMISPISLEFIPLLYFKIQQIELILRQKNIII